MKNRQLPQDQITDSSSPVVDPLSEETDNPDPPKPSKERFYDQLPFTYKQVDIFVKVFGVIIVLFLIFIIATAE